MFQISYPKKGTLTNVLERLAIGFALSLALAALSGCGADRSNSDPAADITPSPGDAQEIRIVAKDNMFDPKTYTAQSGKPLSLVALNEGQNVHEVEVKGLMSESKLTPGQSKTVSIGALTPGAYKIYCEIHSSEGMEGELIIK